VTDIAQHRHHHHTHSHPVTEQPPGPSEGAVVIEIGDGVGAAVIYTDPVLDGEELEIRPASDEWRGAHTAVRERRFSGAVRYAAVFGSLAEGIWELRVRGDTDTEPVLALTVSGGTVVEALWPSRAEPLGAGSERH
jgi:hypothetical protein